MPKILFHPSGKSGEVPIGTSLLDAAEKLGLEMRHDCGGFATCSTCRIWIIEGAPNLSEVDLDEENMLEEAALTAPYRLSCQAKIQGDVTARIPQEEMEWSKSALRELQEQSGPYKDTVRLMVEKKARGQGISVILPDTAIPFIAEVKKIIDEAATDPERLAALIKRIHEDA
jgi:2Fe-2S ferredoxin